MDWSPSNMMMIQKFIFIKYNSLKLIMYLGNMKDGWRVA